MHNSTDAEGSQEATEANTCPPWCQDHEEPDHASKDVAIGPMLVRLYGAAGDEPVVDMVRDARLVDHDRPLSLAEARALSMELATAVARAEIGVNTPAQVEPAHPSWMTTPCPPWCLASDEHADRDHYDDRVHFGPSTEVVLTAVEDRHVTSDDDPALARTYLSQHYREIGPRISLHRDDTPVDITFTPEEAEEFAFKLLGLVAETRRTT